MAEDGSRVADYDIHLLQSSGVDVLQPGSADYDRSVQGTAAWLQDRAAPCFIVRARTEACVVATLRWAARSSVGTSTGSGTRSGTTSSDGARRTVSVCSGGHTSHCAVTGAAMLDLRTMKAVEVREIVSSSGRTEAIVVAQAGASLGDIAVAAEAAGYVVPLGTEATVGLGAVLHGGVIGVTRTVFSAAPPSRRHWLRTRSGALFCAPKRRALTCSSTTRLQTCCAAACLVLLRSAAATGGRHPCRPRW